MRRFKRIPISADTLSGIDVYAQLGAEDRASLAGMCSGGLFPAKCEVVAVDKEDAREVYFVVSGRVRATIHALSGREVSFRDIGAGGVFGDLAAIDGKRRSASVVTLEESMLAWMSPSDFWRVLNTHPTVASTTLKDLAELVRLLTERIVEFSTLCANNRLHSELLRLARDNMMDSNMAEISPPPTHLELASRISSHREGVSREMHHLGEIGLIERGSGRLLVRDVRALENMVRQVKGS